MLSKNFLDVAKITIVGLLLTVGVNALSAATWTSPTATPPGSNASAPITVDGDQIKSGGLVLNDVKSDGYYAATGLVVKNGDVQIGAAGGSAQFCLNGSCKTGWNSYYAKTVISAGGRGVGAVGPTCNSGDSATGGGINIARGSTVSTGSNDDFAGSFPTDDGRGWTCETTKGTARLTCYVICSHNP